MNFTSLPPDKIADLLLAARTIAVVGLSGNPRRPSHEVARALQKHGYRIIPVNPTLSAWESERAVPDLDHLPDVLAPGERVDIVDVFRRPEHVGQIVDDCISLRLPAIWLQLGVVDEAAAKRAQGAGLTVVMDRCMKVERDRLTVHG